MVQKAVETAIIRNSDGSGRSRRSDGWYHRWIRKQPKERWVCGSKSNRRCDETGSIRNSDGSGSIRNSDGSGSILRSDQSGSNGKSTTDGSGSNQRSNRLYHRWIRKQSKKQWMIPPMDQVEVVRTMDGTSVESESSRRCDGTGSSRRWYHRWIRKQSKEQ